MPITRRQFVLEIDAKTEEWMRKIHAFLAEHKDEAFTEQEIRKYFSPALEESLPDIGKRLLTVRSRGGQEADAFDVLQGDREAFELAVERLEALRAITKAVIRDSKYYAYRQDLKEVL